MDQVGLDDIVRPGAVARERRGVMLFRAFRLVIHMRDCADRDAEHAVGRRRDSSGRQLPAGARKVQQWRRVVVARADDKRDLIFLLQVVELFGEFRELVQRTDLVRAQREIPDLVVVGVLLRDSSSEERNSCSNSGSVLPFAGSPFGMTCRSKTPHGLCRCRRSLD